MQPFRLIPIPTLANNAGYISENLTALTSDSYWMNEGKMLAISRRKQF